MNIADSEILKSIKEKMNELSPKAKDILYGSRARGDARKDSDWDLIIIINKATAGFEEFKQIAYPLYDLGLSMGQEINPIIYTVNQWNSKTNTMFYHNVIKEGIVL
ncbi:MAG: nucleotidyltransferase domain-containing protein [Bacteroidales bacterium]|nr:nucleotidyltransferase domain-containing protein [Bacteroidales bacterium]